jgi:tritrans,polycis-undecaprenyl-diphosphate synthase [geranylgeranyl-diphosphate specific]
MTNSLKHVGIILDGNRRFARKLMLEPWKGHEFGKKKIEKLFDWCKEFDIKELTLYCFSMQNFNRPKKEFDYLMKIFRNAFEELKNDSKVHDEKIQINFIGRTHLLPKDVYDKTKELESETKDYSNYKVNFALAYGGREEIIDAVKDLGRQIEDGKIDPKELNEDNFSKFLYMNSEPDLIIRTGGDHRTSNFLVWQSTYSEWMFIEKTWPEFEKTDFVNCINDFTKRQRRFGV